MGLDMYLTRHYFIGGEYEHRKVKGIVHLEIGGGFKGELKVINLKPTEVCEIISRVGYWRKANAIHGWFVDNVQDGKDECQESYVEYDKLLELKELCEEILETKNAELLLPRGGFFFGSTGVDEYYRADLKKTVEIISRLDPKGEYYYHASW